MGARTDLPLTAQGRKQAEAFAAYLKAQGIAPDAIYAGPLRRQAQSAEIIGGAFSTQPRLDQPALNEIDYGYWEGLTTEELLQKWKEPYLEWTHEGKWADGIFGTNRRDHLELIGNWMIHLCLAYPPGSTLVAVTSNGLLRFFHPQWREIAAAKQMETLKVKTGHFCELHLFPDRTEIISWNTAPKKE